MSNKPNTIPFVDLSKLARPIADSTYDVYCSKYRKAAKQYQLTKHEYWQVEMEKWAKKIARTGRALPTIKLIKPTTTEMEEQILVQEMPDPYPTYKQDLGFLAEAIRLGNKMFEEKFKKEITRKGGIIPPELQTMGRDLAMDKMTAAFNEPPEVTADEYAKRLRQELDDNPSTAPPEGLPEKPSIPDQLSQNTGE